MTVGLVAALGSSAGWCLLDATRKQLAGQVDRRAAILGLSVVALPIYGAIAALGGESIDPGPYAALGLAILALNVAANTLFLVALERTAFSAAVPLLSFGPVWTSLAGIAILGQPVAPARVGGLGAVVLGAVVLLAWGPGRSAARPAGPPGAPGSTAGPAGRGGPARALAASPPGARWLGALAMIAVSLCWSLATALDKLALAHAGPGLHATVQVGGVALAMAGWLAATGGLGRVRALARTPGVLVVGGLAGALALVLQLIAVQTVAVAVVDGLKRAIGVGSALVLGWVVFREPLAWPGVLAALCMAAGAIVLAAS